MGEMSPFFAVQESGLAENLEMLRQRFPKVEILPISAAMGEGIPAFKARLKDMLRK